MIPIRPRIGRLLLVAGVLACAGTGQFARAQDDLETEEKVEANLREQQLQALRERERVQVRIANQAKLARWVAIQFGSAGGLQDQLERRLASRLDELKADCRLTDSQVKKLQLAGRGDIKRIMDRLDQVLWKLEDYEDDARELGIAAFELQGARNAAFGEGSLFSKTVARTLSEEQVVDRANALIEKNKLRYSTTVSTAVETLQRNLGLEERQRAELADLLSRESRPPRRFGDASDIALVLFQASRIPTERIRPIFDEAQWLTMSQWMAPYKRGAGGEELLKRHGFVFDDHPAIARPAMVEPATKPEMSRR